MVIIVLEYWGRDAFTQYKADCMPFKVHYVVRLLTTVILSSVYV